MLIGVELRPYGQKLVQYCKHTDMSKLVVAESLCLNSLVVVMLLNTLPRISIVSTLRKMASVRRHTGSHGKGDFPMIIHFDFSMPYLKNDSLVRVWPACLSYSVIYQTPTVSEGPHFSCTASEKSLWLSADSHLRLVKFRRKVVEYEYSLKVSLLNRLH